ncbi:MAG: hypothetical protein ACFFBD_00920 [Candidatus Hodarchaeota archaeon]
MRWPAHIAFGIGTLALFMTIFSMFQTEYGYWGLSQWLFAGSQNWVFVILFSLVVLLVLTPYTSVVIDFIDHEMMKSYPGDLIGKSIKGLIAIPLRFLWSFGGIFKTEKRWLHDYAFFGVPLVLAFLVTIFLPAIFPVWFFFIVAILLVPILSHIFLDNFTKMGVKFFFIRIHGFFAYDHKGANLFSSIIGYLFSIAAIGVFLIDIAVRIWGVVI